jgi:hypothetical protein
MKRLLGKDKKGAGTRIVLSSWSPGGGRRVF